jgi:hypothetical protein
MVGPDKTYLLLLPGMLRTSALLPHALGILIVMLGYQQIRTTARSSECEGSRFADKT